MKHMIGMSVLLYNLWYSDQPHLAAGRVAEQGFRWYHECLPQICEREEVDYAASTVESSNIGRAGSPKPIITIIMTSPSPSREPDHPLRVRYNIMYLHFE